VSKTVYRHDRSDGELKSPTTTSQGFLLVDGHPARAGIYKYRREDGSIQYERRPHEEVFHPDSLASYDDAPLTLEHPADGEVNADNVRRHEIGHVKGPGRQDGDRVATTQIIKDAKAIKIVKAGKQQLSPGYKIILDEKPGYDARYATPDNPTGRYDATQTLIRVNHEAIVDSARGGAGMRLRMDGVEILLDGEIPAEEDRTDAAAPGTSYDLNRFAADASTRASAATRTAHTPPEHTAAAQLHRHASVAQQAAGDTAAAEDHRAQAAHHLIEGTRVAATHATAQARSTGSYSDHMAAAAAHHDAAQTAQHHSNAVQGEEHTRMARGHENAAAAAARAGRRDTADRESGQRADAASTTANATGRAIDHRRAALAHRDAACLMSRLDSGVAATHRDRASAHTRLADRALDVSRLDSSIKLTTAVDGHQHSVDLDPCYGSRMGGCTSYSVSDTEKAEHGHTHDWVRNMDGTITIAMSEGHSHELLDTSGVVGYPSTAELQAAADSAASTPS
jgi:hypothetical protein